MSQACFTLKTEDIGVLAQLGERYNGIVEVRGSIPLGSTRESVSVNSLAKSFDTCSEIYEISRPSYPNAVADFLKKNLLFDKSSKLLELAAGTGKFTDLLVQHDLSPMITEWLPNMLKILKSKHPKLSSVIAKAEDIPFKDNMFDGVLAAQAFHWFANYPALGDIARVLKQNGYLVLVFQERNGKVEWVNEYHKIIFSYPHEAIVRFELGEWKKAFENQNYFSPLEHQQFTYSQHFLKEELAHRALGMSFIEALPEHKKKEVVQLMKNLSATHEQLKNHDVIEFPYITHVYWAKVLK